MKKRIISAAMALIMSACMLPTGILTGAAYDEEPAESLEAINDRIKNSAESFYETSAAENADWKSTTANIISGAMSKIPVEGTPAKIGVWVGQKFLDNLVNSSKPDDTEQILSAINTLNQQNQTALLKLDQLSTLVKDQAKLNAINHYYNGNNVLFSKTKLYIADLQNTEGLTDKQIEENRRNTLVWSIGDTTNIKELNFAEKSYFDQEVSSLGEKLQDTVYLIDGSCSPLDLMNNYSLQHFKWEHQGYEMREKYWSSLANLYMTSANIMYASLNARIEVYEDEYGKGSANLLRGKLKILLDTNKEIKSLAEQTAVTRLPDNLRRYQVLGHEITLCREARKQTLPYLNAGPNDFKCPDGRKTNKHWDSFYMYTDKNKNTYEALSEKYYKDIYNDYNPKGSTERVSLYDIFFSSENGDFIKPKESRGSMDWMFVTNDIKTVYSQSKTIFGQVTNEYWTVADVLLNSRDCSYVEWRHGGDKKMQLNNRYSVIARMSDGSRFYTYIPKEYCDSFIMVMQAENPSNSLPGSGSGQEVVEVTVDDTPAPTSAPTSAPTPTEHTHSLEWKTDQSPTKESTGVKHLECTVCGLKEEAVTIPKLTDDNASQSTSSTVKSPKTGSNSCIVVPAALLAASAAALAAGCVRKRRKVK